MDADGVLTLTPQTRSALTELVYLDIVSKVRFQARSDGVLDGPAERMLERCCMAVRRWEPGGGAVAGEGVATLLDWKVDGFTVSPDGLGVVADLGDAVGVVSTEAPLPLCAAVLVNEVWVTTTVAGKEVKVVAKG